MPKRRTSRALSSAVAECDVFFDRELRELWVGGNLVKRLDCRATNQIAVLTAFQEEDWPRRIDDPLRPKEGADGKSRLRATIHCLNGHQESLLLRFFADGSGHGIRWEPVPSRHPPVEGK
jgi:hypothetical protein